MINFNLKVENLKKTFDGRNTIFNHINIDLKNNSALGFTGRNGSGKSTLMKTIAGVISPSDGKVEYIVDGEKIKKEDVNNYYGYVAPYLMLYEEFTSNEHIQVFMELKGLKYEQGKADMLLDLFKLSNTGDKYISKFSSGMKQRMKFILAIIHEPAILLLDEPFTNLDEDGINIVEGIITRQLEKGGAIVIASNDEREKSFCKEFISL